MRKDHRHTGCPCRPGGFYIVTILKVESLSPNAIEMLGQLYVNGPTWDGNVCSKNGRGELCRAGLAWHQYGYASLTPEGVRVAVEWDINEIRRMGYGSWVEKRRRS